MTTPENGTNGWLVVGIAMLVFSFIFSLIALWWWALAGMDQDVGKACMVTGFVLVFTGWASVGASL